MHARCQDKIALIKNNLTYRTVQIFYTILFLEKSIDVKNDQINTLNKHLEITNKKEVSILLNKVICPRYVGFYMIFGPFLAGYLFVNPPNILIEPFLEWMMLLSFQIWLVPAAIFTLNQIKKLN